MRPIPSRLRKKRTTTPLAPNDCYLVGGVRKSGCCYSLAGAYGDYTPAGVVLVNHNMARLWITFPNKTPPVTLMLKVVGLDLFFVRIDVNSNWPIADLNCRGSVDYGDQVNEYFVACRQPLPSESVIGSGNLGDWWIREYDEYHFGDRAILEFTMRRKS